MSFLFGGEKTSKSDHVKDHLRDLRHAQRSMDREEIKACLQEKVLTVLIKKNANEQRIDICRTKAKELIRLRSHRSRLATMKGHMSTLSHQLSTVQSAAKMQETVLRTTSVLKSLNTKIDAKGVHRMLLEFERHNSQFTMNQEVLEETLDKTFETEGEPEAMDDAISGVFSELGLDLSASMGRVGTDVKQSHEVSIDEIETRLHRLKQC